MGGGGGAAAGAQLERARARAAELQRRLEQTYGKRRRLVEEARGRIDEIRARLHGGGVTIQRLEIK